MTAYKNISFGNYNLASSDATITYSSEHATYLAANASNVIRSKIWQPTGYFEITATNNIIRINDGGGAASAAVTVGTYTAASLATEMQTQLNTTSSGWTVAYNTTTLKFELSNTGSVDLLLSFTTNTIWDVIGFTSSVDQTSTSFTPEEQRIHTHEFYQIDNGTAQFVKAVMVICPQPEDFGLSTSGSVRLQGNNTDSWASPSLDIELSFNERGVFRFIDTDVIDTEYRYHRLKFIDPANPDGVSALRIGFIYMGDAEHIDSSSVARGFSKEQVDPSIILQSENGQQYFDTRNKYEAFKSMTIQNITAADRLKIEQIFNDYGKHTPIFVSLDPGQNLESDPSIYSKYMYFAAEPSYNHLFLTYYAVNLQMREAI